MSEKQASHMEGIVRRDLDRPSETGTVVSMPQRGAHDLRAEGASSRNDRSSHRRTTWLYEDLLN